MKREQIYIIAEIGGNFTDFNTAKRLVDDAKWSGVDAVKLQTYRAHTIASSRAMFDMENTGVVSQTEYFRQYEIDEQLHREVFAYAKEKGLDIFSTPSHMTDVEMLERLGVSTYKIGADDLTNLPFLKAVARMGKPIMLSTGMGTMRETHDAVNAILEEGNNQITIMHVVSIYPTHTEDANLAAIYALKREFPEFVIGYSDHTMTIDACLFAAVMGAQIIEKHFTYDKNAEGPDHMHSATKEEMKLLVDKIRLFELMQGSGIKMPVGVEVKNRINNRKSVVYTKDLKAGELVAQDCLDIKRPGMGIAPANIWMLEGRRLARDVKADDLASWSDYDPR